MDNCRVYDSRTDETLFKGNLISCQKYISDNVEKFEFEGTVNYIWIDFVE